MVTSPVAKLLTDSLKTTVKLMGEALVGSAWPEAWLIVTVGAVTSQVTVLSVLVEAVLALPAASVAPPAPMMGEALVGSAWPEAWLIVTVGAVTSRVTVLSVLVEAVLALPAASVATPAPMVAITVPSVVMPLTATL